MPSDPHRRVMRTTGLGASAICLAGMLAWTTTVTALQAGLLPHKQLVPTAGELGQLARVRSLLATSTKENPNPVHIVFYGQSITLEPWWRKVASELRRMYPDALLTIENKAIAGFQDWALFRTVDADLVPIQPDLVVLHAYGNGTGTDLMLGELRAKTVTDVLLQTDQVHGFDRMDEETDPAKIVYEDLLPYRNYVALPAAARRNDACLARIRDLWKAYLRTNDLPAEAMLSDASVHLNDDGNDLLAEFVLSYLEPGGWAEPIDPWNVPRVRTAVVGKDVRWRDGELECSFVGSVVAVVLQGVLPSDIDVLVDGQRPADRPELYGFSRTSASHFNGWPALSRVGSEAPLVVERWFMAPSDVSADGLRFNFKVWGSVTGPDGEGTSTDRFVSKSGRVVIEPGDHWIGRAVAFGHLPVPPGYTTYWDVERRFVERLDEGTGAPYGSGGMVTLALGLSDEPHRLRLVARDGRGGGIRAVRAFSPKGSAVARSVADDPPPAGTLLVRQGPAGVSVVWILTDEDGRSGWRLEHSQQFGRNASWRPIPTRIIQKSPDIRVAPVEDPPPFGYYRLAPAPKPVNPGRPQ